MVVLLCLIQHLGFTQCSLALLKNVDKFWSTMVPHPPPQRERTPTMMNPTSETSQCHGASGYSQNKTSKISKPSRKKWWKQFAQTVWGPVRTNVLCELSLWPRFLELQSFLRWCLWSSIGPFSLTKPPWIARTRLDTRHMLTTCSSTQLLAIAKRNGTISARIVMHFWNMWFSCLPFLPFWFVPLLPPPEGLVEGATDPTARWGGSSTSWGWCAVEKLKDHQLQETWNRHEQ